MTPYLQADRNDSLEKKTDKADKRWDICSGRECQKKRGNGAQMKELAVGRSKDS